MQVILVSCKTATKEKKEERLIWSQKWFPDNAARLKAAVALDDNGTLLVVGQNFTKTDSIDHPTTLAKISPLGKMVVVKHIGRTGRYKEKFLQKNTPIIFYEDRLVEILKTNDQRILAFGYKTFEHYTRKLWVVELDHNLNILKDTVYKNLGVSDIGKMKAYATPQGWCLVTRNFWQENDRAHYRTPIYEFNADFSCTDDKQNIGTTVEGGSLYLQWLHSIAQQGDDFLLCGIGAITDENKNDDDVKKLGYIFTYNRKSKQTKMLKKCEENMYPMSVLSNGTQFGVLYKYIDKSKQDSIKVKHVMVCYDAKFKELWRDQQYFGKTTIPCYLTYRDELWHAHGYFFEVHALKFYETIYNKNGKLVANKLTGFSYEADAVDELSINNTPTYRLYTDNGWRIDRIGFSE